MSGSPNDIRALRALVREASAQKPPAIDWSEVERGLFAEVEGTPATKLVTHPAPSGSTLTPGIWGTLLGVAMAAACATALVSGLAGGRRAVATRAGASTPSAEPAPVPDVEAEATVGPRDASLLAQGDEVEALSTAVTYRHDGAVTWTLAPHTRVRMTEVPGAGVQSQPTITIALLEGSVHAEVVHRDRGEVFAIEVEKTRVAVHGTSFTVTRQGDRALVEVAHGSVAVGPAAHRGSTPSWVMVGPERASFSLDGARDPRWLGAPAGEPAAPASRPARDIKPEAAGAAAAQNVGPSAPSHAVLPAELPESEWSPIAQRIVAGVAACYEQQLTAMGGVAFTVQSSLTLDIAPDGSIPEAVFSPPLSPRLMTCAEGAIQSAHFPHARGRTHVRVPVELGSPAGEK